MFALYKRRLRSASDSLSAITASSKTEENSDDGGASKSGIPMEIIWENVAVYVLFHVAAVYGAYLMFTSVMLKTFLFGVFLDVFSGIGITAGAHRLWAHRTYKAKFPLRIFLAAANTVAMQKDIFYWCRDHRTHHKYSETNADPHNAKNGFFFSHVGWLLCKKHPDVIEKGKTIDLNDLLEDPVVRYQRKYYWPLAVFLSVVLPTAIPMMLWKESFWNSFFVPVILRYVLVFNQTVLVNSAAHMWGNRPYDKNINPAENYWVTILAAGEGFHNYHHTFPWDYATSEFGIRYNLTTLFINFAAWLGLAYDLRTAPRSVVHARKLRNQTDEKKL